MRRDNTNGQYMPWITSSRDFKHGDSYGEFNYRMARSLVSHDIPRAFPFYGHRLFFPFHNPIRLPQGICRSCDYRTKSLLEQKTEIKLEEVETKIIETTYQSSLDKYRKNITERYHVCNPWILTKKHLLRSTLTIL